MQIHTLQAPSGRKKAKPRVGRGGKRGTYSGRGMKGQRARAGHRIRPAERDYIQRLPKLRGTKNKLKQAAPLIFAVGRLDSLELAGGVVTLESLRSAGVIGKRIKTIKILAGGTLSKPVTVRGIATSTGAKKQIEAAGGHVE